MSILKKNKILAFLASFFIFLFLFNLAFAREFEVEWPEIPGTEFVKGKRCPADGCPPENFADFIVYLFNLALVIAGFVTFVMIIIAGVQYLLLAVESPLAAQAALRRIKNALLGLILLFGGFLILNAIDPELLVPGLEMTKIQGTPLGDLDIFDRECKDGVLICADTNCSGDCRCFHDSVADLSKYNFNDRAKSFRINTTAIVNFWEHVNFSGKIVSVEGPTGSSPNCVTFADAGPPDLTGAVSSIEFQPQIDGVIVCEHDSPSPETCGFFKYKALERAEIAKFKYGEKNIEITFPSVPNKYDLTGNKYEIPDEKATWVQIPGGYFMVACKDAGNPPDKCYFILNSTNLTFYGDGAGINDPLNDAISFFYIVGNTDPNTDKEPCKGVVFYSDDNYNRDVVWTLGLWDEAVAFPIGLGEMDKGSSVDLSSGFKSFTRINDLSDGFPEINLGDDGIWAPDIQSMKLIGNCKIKLCSDKNLGGSCQVYKNNFYPHLCKPGCEASCTATGNPGKKVSCTATCPAGCGAANCTCGCTVPSGASSCSCTCCCSSGPPKSFILCNKDDTSSPCDW